MPEPLTTPVLTPPLHSAAAGFCGKLPARGDFVSAGLPRRFVDPWHDWLQQMLMASREALGESWTAAWLEAPVWRFALAAGVCGPEAAVGLWMPSVDNVGRYFPLTFAVAAPGLDEAAEICRRDGFLAAAEATGRDALADDLGPQDLAARIAAPTTAPPDADLDLGCCPPSGSLWWSDGSPRVPATSFACTPLPDAVVFARMLDAGELAAAEPCRAGR
jgi:type VI secretion system protein ImpM